MGLLGRLVGGLEVIEGDPKEKKILGCKVQGATKEPNVSEVCSGVRGCW
jgi:hypothetical protein